jgi:hypothetical protein
MTTVIPLKALAAQDELAFHLPGVLGEEDDA